MDIVMLAYKSMYSQGVMLLLVVTDVRSVLMDGCECPHGEPSAGDLAVQGFVQATSVLVKEAIDHVRMNYPHWNATDGADHFMVFSYDHARCDQVCPSPSNSRQGFLFVLLWGLVARPGCVAKRADARNSCKRESRRLPAANMSGCLCCTLQSVCAHY